MNATPKPTMDLANRAVKLLGQIGLLRALLVAAAVTTVLAAPEPDTAAVYSGWEIVPTLLMPVIAPMVFMVLLLDALMARVFLSDAEASARTRLKLILTVNLVLAAAMLLAWSPYFVALRR